jgi:hypothetical protein
MELIQKVYAQSADAVASSTIPFQIPGSNTPTPFITSMVSGTPQITQPTIYLETTTNQLAPNDKVTVNIRINTVQQNIKSYKFIIKYDPENFQITDASPDVSNVQIGFNDTFFINDINEVDTSGGTITINAASNQGTAPISGRIVADFEITAIKEGFSTITIQKDNSSLLDSNNTDILKSTGTQLDFVISNTVITITPTQPVPTPTGVLPRNGFFDTFGAANAFITGTILIAVGAYLYKLQRHAKKKI